MHKRALTLILPVFMAFSFAVVGSGCDKKEEKKDEKKVDDKTGEAKEEKADGGW
jgi:hypothetical protein